MVKVIKVPLPVDPVPQKFIYVIELGVTQAHYLVEMLRSRYSGSLTATQIVDGLIQTGL
ncbi:hypothetical protein LCGC14_2813450 [marine sediment metagenome]|uniref:Uncharacterized protein n=1 Tax=marine sediment metagenome TaxID=412755 RepID=A0A0F8YJ81_9ZZZZ